MKYLEVTNLPELPFDVSEAINQLRVNLSFAGVDIKSVVVTSSIPNEGKSFIALGLWRALANVGKRVLLIDGDLRLSQLRSVYGLATRDNFIGIAHLLSGQADIPDVVYKTNVTNGYILPVTTDIADPTNLLESERFSILLNNCEETFDMIIVDTPPLGSVADALNIVRKCDGSILVVRSGFTKKKIVSESVMSLRRTGKPLFGIVLNRVDTSRKSGSYYYNEYYQYGGSKEKKK